jgi:hypothetical protein
LYFRQEGAAKRRKHFDDVWLAVGLQARVAPLKEDRTIFPSQMPI